MRIRSGPLLLALGWCTIAVGLIANQWVLAKIISSDGELRATSKMFILVFQVATILVGVGLIRHRQVLGIAARVTRHPVVERISFNERIFLLGFFGWSMAWTWEMFWLRAPIARQIAQPTWGHPLFSHVFASPVTTIVSTFLPVVAVVLVLLTVATRLPARVYPWVCGMLILSSLGRLWHYSGYNDAAAVAALWAAVWLWWFSVNIQRTDRAFYTHAITFGQGVVSLCFLAGFIGKLTADYWVGTPVYELRFAHPDSMFNLFAYPVRRWFSPEEQVVVARWMSRSAVAMEGVVAASVLLPTRIAVPIGIFVMCGMMATLTIQLFGLLAALISILLACWWLDKRLRTLPAPVPAS